MALGSLPVDLKISLEKMPWVRFRGNVHLMKAKTLKYVPMLSVEQPFSPMLGATVNGPSVGSLNILCRDCHTYIEP